MSFTLRRLAGGRVVSGLHALGRPGYIVEVGDECVLPEPEVAAAWTALRSAWGEGARLLPEGGRLRLTLRVGPNGSVALLVQGGRAGWSPSGILSSVPEIQAVVHRPEGGDAGELRETADEDDHGVGFEQVNAGAAALLGAYVVAQASGAERVVDAYCGSGRYGRALAGRGATVIGIELDADAAADGTRHAPPGLSIRGGRTEELLADALPTDLLILNPPRTGVAPEVVDIVLGVPPERLIYVSCDPATLARDLAGLSSRYALAGVRCFDLFPQTAHVETVVTMNLTRGG
jgi:23S rRNA (uracil1939-C5)-methyltransferase